MFLFSSRIVRSLLMFFRKLIIIQKKQSMERQRVYKNEENAKNSMLFCFNTA